MGNQLSFPLPRLIIGEWHFHWLPNMFFSNTQVVNLSHQISTRPGLSRPCSLVKSPFVVNIATLVGQLFNCLQKMLCSAQFLAFFFRISTTKATVLLPLSSLSHAPHILGFHKSHLSWPWIARAPKGWTSRGTSEFSGFGRRLTLVCLKLRYSTEFNGLLSSSPLKCLYKTQCRYLLYIFSICWWCNILRFLLYQRTPLVQLSNCDMDWYGSIVCLLSWVMWDSINMSNCSIPSNLELCPNGTETSILRVPDWAIDFQCWFHGYPPWRPSKKGIFVTSFFNKWLFVRVS